MIRSSANNIDHSFHWENSSLFRVKAEFRTPRPTPQFYIKQQTFSTKKERQTPHDRQPPKPPIKSAPPLSRIFPHRLHHGAQQVSFKDSNDTSILSTHYDEEKRELYFDQCFEIEDKLGAGSFGEVFKVRSKEDGQCYAVKRSRERFRGESDRKRKLEEAAKAEKLPYHPNCVQFIKAWEERQHLYIQTELCKASLNTLAENDHYIPERLICNYLVDLLMAAKHLHDHDLVHMDIKPENIFVSFHNVCKLGDFGLVIDLGKDVSEALEGDPKYLAPELMLGKFGKAADVFSLGITILELASDVDLPRGGDLWHQLRSGEIPDEVLYSVSSDLKSVIKLMMEPNPDLRPSVQELLSHPSVKKMRFNRMCDRGVSMVTWAISTVFQSLASLLFTMFLSLIYPLNAYVPCHVAHTPLRKSRPAHPPDWDHSFSEEEIFDDDINIMNNSIGQPLNVSTSSEDSVDGKLLNHDHQKALTTPGVRHGLLNLHSVGSSNSPAFSSLGSHFSSSPTSTPICEPQHPHPITPNTSFHQMCLEEELQKRELQKIAPKNLMDVFEGAMEEEEF